MKYTKDPWEYCEIQYNGFEPNYGPFGSIEPCVKIGERVIKIGCFVFPGATNEEYEQRKQDARLMAAAPDMYEALLKALRFIINGRELGYIQMPDANSGDSALKTPDIIRQALAKAEGKDDAICR